MNDKNDNTQKKALRITELQPGAGFEGPTEPFEKVFLRGLTAH
jgi:hypothetical protein